MGKKFEGLEGAKEKDDFDKKEMKKRPWPNF
jgi:hypothetical protein